MLPAIAAGSLATIIAVPLVVKVLAGLGFGFFVYQGLDALVSTTKDYLIQQFAGLPGDMLAIMSIAQIDKAITILFSAYAVKMLLMGMSASGVLTRFGAKGL